MHTDRQRYKFEKKSPPFPLIALRFCFDDNEHHPHITYLHYLFRRAKVDGGMAGAIVVLDAADELPDAIKVLSQFRFRFRFVCLVRFFFFC